MLPALAAATDELPSDRLRYLMGVGDPVSLVEAVALGVDLFDCVLPSRLGRHGTVLTDGGRINLRNARFTRDDSPLDPIGLVPRVGAVLPGLPAPPAVRPTSPRRRRLLTLHNLGWLLRFVDRMRTSIGRRHLRSLPSSRPHHLGCLISAGDVSGGGSRTSLANAPSPKNPGSPRGSPAPARDRRADVLLPHPPAAEAGARTSRHWSAATEVGDEVMTSSGIYGIVTELEDDTFLIEIAEGIEMRMAAGAIAERSGTQERRDRDHDRRRPRRADCRRRSRPRPSDSGRHRDDEQLTDACAELVLVPRHHRRSSPCWPWPHARVGQHAPARPRPAGRCVGRAAAQGRVDSGQLDQAIEIIRNRVDALGVAEPEIARQGTRSSSSCPA